MEVRPQSRQTNFKSMSPAILFSLVLLNLVGGFAQDSRHIGIINRRQREIPGRVKASSQMRRGTSKLVSGGGNKVTKYHIESAWTRCANESVMTHCEMKITASPRCEWCVSHDGIGSCMDFPTYLMRSTNEFKSCSNFNHNFYEHAELTRRTDWEEEKLSCLGFEKNYDSKYFGQPGINLTEHFFDLFRRTRDWRACPNYSYQFKGPRLENFWIQDFLRKLQRANFDLELVFPGGVVPLFIQWIDCVIFYKEKFSYEVSDFLRSSLRSDVIYVTVSQSAEGIHKGNGIFGEYYIPKNLFIFNSGGYGHVPLPLLNIELSDHLKHCGGTNELSCTYFSSFVGSISTGFMRKMYFQRYTEKSGLSSIKIVGTLSSDWESIMESSTTSLAPRGYGRTSFRLFESIQKGILPIYIYDDVEWIPYAGTKASLHNFGFSVHYSNLSTALIDIYNLLNTSEISRRRKIMSSFRNSHYSYSGILSQIGLYLKYGPSVSDLRCMTLPTSKLGPKS